MQFGRIILILSEISKHSFVPAVISMSQCSDILFILITKAKFNVCVNKYFQPVTDTGQKESLKAIFQDFQGVCRTYTATGKGIMGMQAAEGGDMSKAAKLWEEAGKLGNAKSKFNLALCYEKGSGVKKSLSKVCDCCSTSFCHEKILVSDFVEED